MPRAVVSHLVGLPQSNVWSHAGSVECGRQTSLVYVLSLSGLQASNLGQGLVARLDAVRLSSTADIYGLFQQLVEQMARQDVRLSLSAVLMMETKLALVTWRGSIILRRANLASRLLSSTNQIGILEGKWQKDDVLVISTAGANHYQTELCQRLADGFETNVIRQAINSEVERDNQAAGIAMSFIVPKNLTTPPPDLSRSITADEKIDQVVEETHVNPPNETELEESLVPPAPEPSDPEPESTTPPKPQSPSFMSVLPGLGKRVLQSVWSKLRLGGQKVVALRPKTLMGSSKVSAKYVFKQVTAQLRWLWQVITGQKIYLDTAPTKPRRLIFLAVLAGLFFVILILGLWIWQGRQRALAQLSPLITARQQIQDLTSSDVFQARTQAINLRTELSRSATASGADSSLVRLTNQELAKVDQILLELAQKTELQELPVFLDLNSVLSGFVIELSAASASQAGLLDIGQKQLARLSLTDKTTTTAPVTLTTRPVSMTMVDDGPVVLSEGILALTGETPQKLVEVGDSNRDATLLANAGDTLYVFNPVKRNIFRYTKSATGYSKPVGWLIEPLGADFENVVTMAVDDRVWLGTNQGQVLLFQSGRAQPFTIQGLAQPLTGLTALATRPDRPDLFILDSQNARVLVIDKNSGQLKREIVSISLKSVSALLVSSQGVYGVSGSLIYQLPD